MSTTIEPKPLEWIATNLTEVEIDRAKVEAETILEDAAEEQERRQQLRF